MGDIVSNAFSVSAGLYDSCYRRKDYEREVAYVLGLATEFGGHVTRVLDLGCGTGGHMVPLCRRGVSVTGVDAAQEMVAIAERKLAENGFANQSAVHVGNATSYRDGEKYNAVTFMFAVLGYMTQTADIIAALQTARAHLQQGGIVFCDVWFGPTVLNELPETRVQEFLVDGDRTIRIAVPEIDVVRNTVTVNYDMLRFASPERVVEAREKHEMRYFFIEEVKTLFSLAGLSLLHSEPFCGPRRQPRLGDWNISLVAAAQ